LGSSNKRNDLIAQEIGLNRGNPKALDPFHRIQRLHQVEESILANPVPDTKVSDIDSCQNNLFDARSGNLRSLSHDVSNFSTPTTTSGLRDGTERARVIASVLNFQKRAGPISNRKGRDKNVGLFNRRIINHRLWPLGQVINMLDNVKLLSSAQHHVHTGNISNLLRL